MDFYRLVSKMSELSKPLTENAIGECGGVQTPHAPPTMTVSLNANGLDDISSLMRLLVKVNPDMMPKDNNGPAISSDPNILTISNNHAEPLKMLPEPRDLDGDEDGDLDNDEDEGMAGSIAGGLAGLAATKSFVGASTGASIGSEIQDKFFGSADEEETDEELDGGFQSANTSNNDTRTFGTDKLVGTSNGLDKEKTMHKHSYKQGDNPLAMKADEFKESIRLDLHRRLAELKTR